MKTRILPALAVLPLLAACVEAPDTPSAAEETLAVAAAPAQQVAAAVPARTPPAVPPAEPDPVTPVSNVSTPPAAPPQPREVLGTPPPPAAEAEPEVEEAAAEEEPAAPAAAGRLGTVVANVGSPAQGGLWLETPLVEAPTAGRVEYNGQSVNVELRPSGGERGSRTQISLDAMRALNIPITSLPELTVFAG